MKQARFSSWIPWILLLFCSVCYVSLIFNQNVWMDEAFTASLIRTDMSGVISRSMQDTLPPLYNILLKLMTDAFGYSVPVMKLTSVLPMIATLVLSATVVKKRHGLMSCCLWMLALTFMPLMLNFGIEIRMYSWGFFFATASGVFAYEVIYESRPKNWILFTLFSVLAGYTHHFAFVTAGTVYFFLLLYYLIKDRAHVRRWFFCVLATTLLYLPCLLTTLKQIGRVSGYFSMPEVTFSVFVKYMIYPFITGNRILSVLLGLGMLLLYGYGLYRQKTAPSGRQAYALLCPVPYYIVLLFGTAISKIMTANIFVDRYLFFACGLIWLFFAIEISILPPLRFGKKSLPWAAVAIPFLILIGLFTGHDAWKQEYGQDPADMIGYFQSHVQENDALLIYSDSEALYWCLQFYEPAFKPYSSAKDALNALHEGETDTVWIAVEEGRTVADLEEDAGEKLPIEQAGDFAFDRYDFTLYRLTSD